MFKNKPPAASKRRTSDKFWSFWYQTDFRSVLVAGVIGVDDLIWSTNQTDQGIIVITCVCSGEMIKLDGDKAGFGFG